MQYPIRWMKAFLVSICAQTCWGSILLSSRSSWVFDPEFIKLVCRTVSGEAKVTLSLVFLSTASWHVAWTDVADGNTEHMLHLRSRWVCVRVFGSRCVSPGVGWSDGFVRSRGFWTHLHINTNISVQNHIQLNQTKCIVELWLNVWFSLQQVWLRRKGSVVNSFSFHAVCLYVCELSLTSYLFWSVRGEMQRVFAETT